MGGVEGRFWSAPSASSRHLRHGVDGSGARVTMSFQLWQRQDPGDFYRQKTPPPVRNKQTNKSTKNGQKIRGNKNRWIEFLNLRYVWKLSTGRICWSNEVTPETHLDRHKAQRCFKWAQTTPSKLTLVWQPGQYQHFSLPIGPI